MTMSSESRPNPRPNPRPISGRTKLAAVIGDPVEHSLSPTLYNAAFAARGKDWRFVAFTVRRGGGGAAVEAMRTLGLWGLSVTMPHKEDVIAACDRVTDRALALRSVNHIAWGDDELVGDSTDGDGFVRSLRDVGVELPGRNVLLLGAGGAARSVALALTEGGASVTCAARRVEAAASLASLCHGSAADLADAATLAADHDLLVNATPMGMNADRTLVLPTTAIRAAHVVADLVYSPLDTVLLGAARAAGAQAVDGLGMLVHQAALQFESWTESEAPVAAMRAAAEAELAAR